MEPHEERIAELRGQIDEIDRQLIELFERRMDVSREIGAVKREHNLGIRNERRELEVKANCRACCKNDAYRDYAQAYSMPTRPITTTPGSTHTRILTWRRN